MRHLVIVSMTVLAAVLVLGLSGQFVSAQTGEPSYSTSHDSLVLQPAMCGLKPWVIPDRWHELSSPPNDVFDPDIDIYDSAWGYQWPGDIGSLIVFAPDNGTGTTVHTGQYKAIRFGPVNRGGPDCNGANCYLKWIVDCEPYWVQEGDTFQVEQGVMVGPTKRGLDSLISRDPGAYYDSLTKTIRTSHWFGISPRLVPIATFDPSAGLTDGHHVVINRILKVFIEGYDDHANFWGRLMRIDEPCPDSASVDDCLHPWPFPPSLQVTSQLSGDITGDGRTDLSDLSVMIGYLTSAGAPTPAFSLDITGDGAVDLKDLAVLIGEVTGRSK